MLVATYLAPSLRPLYQFVVDALGRALGRPAHLVEGRSYEELTRPNFHFAFVCGLPYVRLRREDPAAEAIAAPVLRGERYGGRPIYFSDVIVPVASPARSLADLRGCSWAYNEPQSHSGYLATLYRLHEVGETASYFGSWVRTGLHQRSIRMVAEGRVDASAIDSQVLAVELRDHPALRARLRVIDSFGPATIQPLVATRLAPGKLRRQVVEIVAQLAGGPVLDRALVERFVPVDDAAYGDIRAMLEAVGGAADVQITGGPRGAVEV